MTEYAVVIDSIILLLYLYIYSTVLSLLSSVRGQEEDQHLQWVQHGSDQLGVPQEDLRGQRRQRLRLLQRRQRGHEVPALEIQLQEIQSVSEMDNPDSSFHRNHFTNLQRVKYYLVFSITVLENGREAL